MALEWNSSGRLWRGHHHLLCIACHCEWVWRKPATQRALVLHPALAQLTDSSREA